MGTPTTSTTTDTEDTAGDDDVEDIDLVRAKAAQLDHVLAYGHAEEQRALVLERARDKARRTVQAEREAEESSREHDYGFIDGGAWMFDIPDRIPTLWGDGDDVLWPRGEALMLCGSSGTGKTTIAAQIVRALCGLGDGLVLGIPVTPTPGRVLYLAMDRPAQARRLLGTIFRGTDRAAVTNKFVPREGPPPADVVVDSKIMLKMARAAGADVIVVDSLKDIAVGLSDDAVGAAYNRARQECLAGGVDVLELHHLVKRNANGGQPTALADIYGSTWLTAGAGSVLLLVGSAGDLTVKMKHLKQPLNVVGPLDLVHQRDQGRTVVEGRPDLYMLLQQRSDTGVNVTTAMELFLDLDDGETATTAQKKSAKERARRKLDSLVAKGHAWSVEQGGSTLWFPGSGPRQD